MPSFFLQAAWKGSVGGMAIIPGCDIQSLSPFILFVLVSKARP